MVAEPQIDADELSKKRTHEDALGVGAPAADEAREEQQQQQQLTCAMCETSDVKYRCPRCERITCSLECCLDHKKTYSCDGKRDRTQYVELKQFTDANLSSDFFFLEEVARSTNSAARSRSQMGLNARHFMPKKGPAGKKRKVASGKAGAAKPVNPHVASDWLLRFPVPFQLLVQHAAKRGVDVTLLAPGMSKRVRNTSYMDIRKNVLYWRVEWTFPSADTTVNLFEVKVSDAETPFAILAQYLTKNPENASVRGKLRKYAVSDWQHHVVLLLRKEFTPASEPQYYRLDGNLSLESNFKRKPIVEFPVIVVALKSDAGKYPVAYDRIEVLSEVEEHDSEAEEGVAESAEAPEDVAVDPEDEGEAIEVEEVEEVKSVGIVSDPLLSTIAEDDGDDELMLLDGEEEMDEEASSFLSSMPPVLIEELNPPPTAN
uniref:HIT-type domain-containing protein n=1 Tax=Globisporangium ultimum (strain ATCC 200006 / CBS 805.95 / DAOM BR144) TaxID=431595 RepID=K3X7G2_GLOUD